MGESAGFDRRTGRSRSRDGAAFERPAGNRSDHLATGPWVRGDRPPNRGCGADDFDERVLEDRRFAFFDFKAGFGPFRVGVPFAARRFVGFALR